MGTNWRGFLRDGNYRMRATILVKRANRIGIHLISPIVDLPLRSPAFAVICTVASDRRLWHAPIIDVPKNKGLFVAIYDMVYYHTACLISAIGLSRDDTTVGRREVTGHRKKASWRGRHLSLSWRQMTGTKSLPWITLFLISNELLRSPLHFLDCREKNDFQFEVILLYAPVPSKLLDVRS